MQVESGSFESFDASTLVFADPIFVLTGVYYHLPRVRTVSFFLGATSNVSRRGLLMGQHFRNLDASTIPVTCLASKCELDRVSASTTSSKSFVFECEPEEIRTVSIFLWVTCTLWLRWSNGAFAVYNASEPIPSSS